MRDENHLDLSPDFRVEPADYHADFKDLRAVREPVFVVEQNVPLELEWDDLDPLCHHVIARDAEHRPIGTGRLTPEHKIGRLAVLKEWRGRGVGDALLQALIDQARRFAWPEVSLHAQVDAVGFYEKWGFVPYGERFDEAGIRHQSMKLSLPPLEGSRHPGMAPRGPSVKPMDFDNQATALAATVQLIDQARRHLVVYTRGLEHSLYAQAAVVEAFKRFGTSRRGGVARIIVQDPLLPRAMPHPLLALAQRLSTALEFRTPVDPEDLQYPSAFLANDHDGYLFRMLDGRFEGDWSPALPARNRQLTEGFDRVWQRCRPCTEFRALGI
jgi:predicted GNAT family N-acyltransferase